MITNLTWAGHEFAELARDDDRWAKAVAECRRNAGPVTVDRLRQLLADLAGGAVVGASERAERLERDVAAVYRALGAHVEQEVVLAGNRVDILVDEHSASGARVRTAIECKAYARPVGVDVVTQYASLIALLKERRLVDRGTLVTSNTKCS
jgi:hypothetical protein